MARNGWQREVKRTGKLTNRRIATGEPREDRAPGRIGESTEGRIEQPVFSG